MAYTWAQFKAAVFTGFLTDRTASNTNFAAACAEYVRARIARDVLGDAAAYALAEKRYTALRRGLAGYSYTADDAALQAEVRALFSDGARTNTQVAQAIALYIRAESAREVEARGEGGSESALAIAKSCRIDYQLLRLRLCGFNHTLEAGLTDEVNKYLPVESQRLNTADYRAALQAAAVEDIEAFGDWFDTQVATAKDDLQALSDRVESELRATVIDLQHHIRAYTLGQEDTFTADDVEDEGNASVGTLSDGAQVRSARIERSDEPQAELSIKEACRLVDWADRFDLLVQSTDCGARIAISPKGDQFMVTPRLDFPRPQLLIEWDGMKLNFEDNDATPFDEGAVQAVGYGINAALAAEWGESVGQQQLWRGKYAEERSKLYLRHKRRGEVLR